MKTTLEGAMQPVADLRLRAGISAVSGQMHGHVRSRVVTTPTNARIGDLERRTGSGRRPT
ncbi:hypothetical protein ACIP6P_30540 [Streptomyces sp. NPDC088729]|uniref:hypothetical protein n=1 Tax=Streptomyces sp. NPDC088729 TaxID=3365876 RepID=UPI0038085846